MSPARFRTLVRLNCPDLLDGVTSLTEFTEAIRTIAGNAGFRHIHLNETIGDVLDELWGHIERSRPGMFERL